MLSENLIDIIVNYIGYNNKIKFNCDFLEENIDNLNWIELTKNKYIPFNFLSKYQDYISWEFFCYRQDIPISFISDHLNEINWDHSDFPEEFIEEIMKTKNEKKLNWNIISQSKNISVDFYEKYINKLNWYLICENETIPYTFFEKYSRHPIYYKRIDYINLSENPNIPLLFFENNLNYIDWDSLTAHKNLSVEFIEKYNHLYWDFSQLSRNEGLPLSFFQKNHNKIDWNNFSSNQTIPLWYFEENKNKLNYFILSGNENIPYTFYIPIIENFLNDPSISPFLFPFVEHDFSNIENYLKTNNIPFKTFLFNFKDILQFSRDINITNELSDYYDDIFYKVEDIDNFSEYMSKFLKYCNNIINAETEIEFDDFKIGIKNIIIKLIKQFEYKINWTELSYNRKMSFKLFEKFLFSENQNTENFKYQLINK